MFWFQANGIMDMFKTSWEVCCISSSKTFRHNKSHDHCKHKHYSLLGCGATFCGRSNPVFQEDLLPPFTW